MKEDGWKWMMILIEEYKIEELRNGCGTGVTGDRSDIHDQPIP